MTTLTVSNRSVAELKGDALVLVSVQTEKGAALAPGHGLGEETVAHVGAALSTLKAKGKEPIPEPPAKIAVNDHSSGGSPRIPAALLR